jgi:hypothetical protein
MHVGPLPVLDDLMQKDVAIIRRLNPAGDFAESRFRCRMETPLAGDDPVHVFSFDVADGDRLQQAEAVDRGCKFFLPVRRYRTSVAVARDRPGYGGDPLVRTSVLSGLLACGHSSKQSDKTSKPMAAGSRRGIVSGATFGELMVRRCHNASRICNC